MSKSPGFRGILAKTILRWRWGFVSLLILTIIAYQIFQQQIYGVIFSDLRVLPGIIINSLVVPLLIGVVLSLEYERIKLRNMVGYHQSVNDSQDRLARYLHDTLGHNIAFMRLKLDQLMGTDAVKNSPEMRHEIGRLLEVANEAYEQVRGTLVELRRESTSDLPSVLKNTAEIIGRRANFCVEMVSKGIPQVLQPKVQRQVLYVAREALRNIEKHAHAENVWVDLTWNEGELSLTISDDGKGFNPTTPTTEGHFGLKLIQECADELNGRLTVTSSVKTGTHMRLVIPLSHSGMS
jgi:signal transduction histidine kinase